MNEKPKLAEVIPLYLEERMPIATCPDCECQEWYIVLDGFGREFKNIKRFDCVECGFRIVLEAIENRKGV